MSYYDQHKKEVQFLKLYDEVMVIANKIEESYGTEMSDRIKSFFKRFHLISEILKQNYLASNPAMVNLSLYEGTITQITNLKNQLNAFLSSKNEGYLTNSDTNLNHLSNYSQQLSLNMNKTAYRSLSKSAAAHNKSFSEHSNELQNYYVETKNSASGVKSDLENLKSKLTDLEDKVQNKLNDWSTTFTNSQNKRSEDYQASKEQRTEDWKTLLTELGTDQKKLEISLDEANNAFITNQSTNIQKIVDDRKKILTEETDKILAHMEKIKNS